MPDHRRPDSARLVVALGRLLGQAEAGLVLRDEFLEAFTQAVEQVAWRPGSWLGCDPERVLDRQQVDAALAFIAEQDSRIEALGDGCGVELEEAVQGLVRRVERWWRFQQRLDEAARGERPLSEDEVRHLLVDGFDGIRLEDRQVEELALAVRHCAGPDAVARLAALVTDHGAGHGAAAWSVPPADLSGPQRT